MYCCIIILTHPPFSSIDSVNINQVPWHQRQISRICRIKLIQRLKDGERGGMLKRRGERGEKKGRIKKIYGQVKNSGEKS